MSCLLVSELAKLSSILLVMALVQASCGPGYQAPAVDEQLVKIAKKPVSQLERGYIVHQAKCAKCHAFEDRC